MKASLQVVLAALALVVIATGSAYAYPGSNSSCTNCHADGSGDLALPAAPFDIPAGSGDLLSFDVGSLPAANGNNMIAIEDLTQAGLEASIGGGGDNWALGAMTKSDQGIGVGAYTMDLQIASTATPGPYSLTWYLAGGQGQGPNGTSGVFTVNVLAAVIPEPATLALFGLGVTALGLVRRRR